MKKIGIKRPYSFIIFALIVVLFIATIYPAVYASQWNYFGSDDIWFGRFVHNDWVRNHNIFTALGAALYTSANTWTTWQGNWSAVVMFALNPAVFDNWGFENFWGPCLVMFTLCLGTIVLVRTIAKYCFNAKWEVGLTLGFALCIVFTQLVPSFRSAFYWWAAAVNYGFYTGLFFLMIAAIIMIFKRSEKWKRVLYTVWVFLLSSFIAGGMYVFITLIVTGVIFGAIYKELIYKNKKDRWLYLLMIPFTILSLLNILAPGNTHRLASEASQGIRGGLDTIITSISYAIKQMFLYALSGDAAQNGQKIAGPSIPYFASLVIIGIFIWVIVKPSKFKFKFPFLIPIMGIVALGAYYTPNVFASGWDIKPRVFDGGYYLWWAVLVISGIFIMGWMKPKLIQYYKKNKKTVSQTIFGNAAGLVQIIMVPVLVAVFGLGYTNMVNYVNGFEGIPPGGLGAIQALNDTSQETTDSGNRNMTMPELNVEYKNYFIASLLGKKDPNDPLVKSCVNDFYAPGCQEAMASAKDVELPDTREGDKLLTAHVDMCPTKGVGYNSYAEVYWNKLDKPEDAFDAQTRVHHVNAFYPDFNTIPTGTGDSYKYPGIDEQYQGEKQQTCQGYGFLNS